MKISFAVILAIILTGCLSTGGKHSGVPEEVRTAFGQCLTSEGTDAALCRLHAMFPYRDARIDFDFDGDSLDYLTEQYHAERYLVRWGFHDVEAKYAFSWFLHILDAKADIRAVSRRDRDEWRALHVGKHGELQDDPRRLMIGITAGTSARKGHPFFDCYLDRSGEWCDKASRRLEEAYEGSAGELSVTELISQLGKSKGLSFIIDPAIPLESTRRKVSLAPTRQSVRQALSSALSQVDADFRLQGGVILLFARKPETPKAPEPGDAPTPQLAR